MQLVVVQEHLQFLTQKLQAIQRWRTGRRSFRLTSSSTNSLLNGVFTSAETDYVAKGMMNTVQGTILSTREGKIARTNH